MSNFWTKGWFKLVVLIILIILIIYILILINRNSNKILLNKSDIQVVAKKIGHGNHKSISKSSTKPLKKSWSIV